MYLVRGRPRDAVLKLYEPDWAWKARKEAAIYGLLERHGVAAGQPELLHEGEVDGLAAHALVLSRLDGALLVDVLKRVGEEEALALQRQTGRLLRRIHQVPMPAFGHLGDRAEPTDSFATNGRSMAWRFEEKLRLFRDLGGSAETAGQVERRFAAGSWALHAQPRAALCHNDCHDGNLFAVQDGGRWRVTGIVDFEDALAGDPLLDLAKAYAWSSRRSSAALLALAEGYGDLRSGWQEAVQVHALYFAVELWAWFAQAGTTQHLPGLEEDMRRICETGRLTP